MFALHILLAVVEVLVLSCYVVSASSVFAELPLVVSAPSSPRLPASSPVAEYCGRFWLPSQTASSSCLVSVSPVLCVYPPAFSKLHPSVTNVPSPSCQSEVSSRFSFDFHCVDASLLLQWSFVLLCFLVLWPWSLPVSCPQSFASRVSHQCFFLTIGKCDAMPYSLAVVLNSRIQNRVFWR